MLKLIVTPIRDCDESKMLDAVIRMDDSPIAISADTINRLERAGALKNCKSMIGRQEYEFSKEAESLIFTALKESVNVVLNEMGDNQPEEGKAKIYFSYPPIYCKGCPHALQPPNACPHILKVMVVSTYNCPRHPEPPASLELDEIIKICNHYIEQCKKKQNEIKNLWLIRPLRCRVCSTGPYLSAAKCKECEWELLREELRAFLKKEGG